MTPDQNPSSQAYGRFVVAVLFVLMAISGGGYVAIKAGWWTPEPIRIVGPSQR